jgi:hypothetical protein
MGGRQCGLGIVFYQGYADTVVSSKVLHSSRILRSLPQATTNFGNGVVLHIGGLRPVIEVSNKRNHGVPHVLAD